MNDESSPKGASESFGGDETSVASLDLDGIHHAWSVGYRQGMAAGQRMAVKHLAHELLHKQAAEMAGFAVSTARSRHGDGWAALVSAQAAGDER